MRQFYSVPLSQRPSKKVLEFQGKTADTDHNNGTMNPFVQTLANLRKRPAKKIFKKFVDTTGEV
jgi:hypothetical protein